MQVSSGSFFVVGDNIDVSLDSRIFGPVERASIFAKPLYTYRPLARAGIRLR
jgi:type IV secretory pathway protease TraF